MSDPIAAPVTGTAAGSVGRVVETMMKDAPLGACMATARSVMSPVCQLPARAVTALEQAEVDDLLEPGAFTAMGHLAASAVLADALEYADRLVESAGAGDLQAARASGALAGARLLPADAAFLSQVLALGDVAAARDVKPEKDAGLGPSLGDLAEGARAGLVGRIASWRSEPGRRSGSFRVQVGETGALWPAFVLRAEAGEVPDPTGDVDALALFGWLPFLAPFVVVEEDCFVAPRLE